MSDPNAGLPPLAHSVSDPEGPFVYCGSIMDWKGLDAAIDLNHAVFLASRDLVVHKPGSKVLRRWRLWLFAFLYRNAVKAVDRFNLPPKNVVEIARQVEI